MKPKQDVFFVGESGLGIFVSINIPMDLSLVLSERPWNPLITPSLISNRNGVPSSFPYGP